MPLLEPFFNETNGATTADICELIRLLNTDAQDRKVRPKLTFTILQTFVGKNEARQDAIYKECPTELPSNYKTRLSLQNRFHFALKRNRIVHRPPMVETCLNSYSKWTPFVIDFIKDAQIHLNNRNIESSMLSPLNQQVKYYVPALDDYHTKASFKSELEIFFRALFHTPGWFISVGNDEKMRPVLVPSLNLPPQLLEPIGYLMARAAIYGLELPCQFDQIWMNLLDSPLPYAHLAFFHLYRIEGVCTLPEVLRVYWTLDWTCKRIFDRLDSDGSFSLDAADESILKLEESKTQNSSPEQVESGSQIVEFSSPNTPMEFGSVQRSDLNSDAGNTPIPKTSSKQSKTSPKKTQLERSELVQIMMIGVDRFMSGVAEAFPVEDFTVKELHAIIFK